MSLTTDDCIACGACCFGSHPRYVRLFPEDSARNIPPAALTVIDGTAYMTMSGGHCAQLQRGPGETALCGIYDERPLACRAFRLNSFECLVTRRDKFARAALFRSGQEPPEQPEPSPPVLPRAA